jgi:hypothetical protein
MGERQTGMLGKPVAVREETGSSGYTLRRGYRRAGVHATA